MMMSERLSLQAPGAASAPALTSQVGVTPLTMMPQAGMAA